jgi:hypothetical protein
MLGWEDKGEEREERGGEGRDEKTYTNLFRNSH